MSTRSIIVVHGKDRHGRDSVTRLYKHSDGYPTGNLPIIVEALQASIKCILDEVNMNPKDAQFDSIRAALSRPLKEFDRMERLSVEMVVGKLIGVATDYYGMGAVIDDDYDRKDKTSAARYSEPLCRKHLGNQGDLEWIYVIDCEKLTLDVFNGDQASVLNGETVDPTTYAQQLREEYKAGEAKAIRKAMADVQVKCEFELNGARQSKEVKSEVVSKPKRSKKVVLLADHRPKGE